MAGTRKTRPNLWTATDKKTLRNHVGTKGDKAMGRQLKRTERAVRQKALVLGISLRVR